MNVFQTLKNISKIRLTMSTAYEPASQTRRTQNWHPTSASINAILFSELNSIIHRSRDIVRKNPYAASGVEALVSNIVGSGINPIFNWEDEKFTEQTQKLWDNWSVKCDAQNRLDFHGMQELACREMIESGDIFLRFRNRLPSDGLKVPFQLQMIEAEQLNTSLSSSLSEGSAILNGVEYDSFGTITFYHFYKNHPGDVINNNLETVKVSAKQVVHMYKMLRAGQQRGLPWLTTIIIKLHELEKYEDAELLRKQIAAMYAAFITRTLTDDDATFAPNANIDEFGPGIAGASLEPGTMQYLEPGEDIKFSAPADLGDAYESFLRAQLQAVAAGLGVMYEQLTGDLRNVNYSSIRAGSVEFRRKIEAIQSNILIHQMCRPIFREFMKKAFISGALPIPSDFNTDNDKYLNVHWATQGFDWVDPAKDIKSTVTAIRAGIESRTRVTAKRGINVKELDKEIKKERDRETKENLVFESNAGNQKEKTAPTPTTTKDKNKVKQNV